MAQRGKMLISVSCIFLLHKLWKEWIHKFLKKHTQHTNLNFSFGVCVMQTVDGTHSRCALKFALTDIALWQWLAMALHSYPFPPLSLLLSLVLLWLLAKTFLSTGAVCVVDIKQQQIRRIPCHKRTFFGKGSWIVDFHFFAWINLIFVQKFL